ncbi:MAG: hypothetical protein ACD_46C00222G0003 [uncultured bacterium]|nr:MAG: hypothetical protein ACD_46C00222G0003 [uncultured bacterium]
MKFITSLKDVNSADIETVGGKNASIGEMLQNLSKMGVEIPGGFAITVSAYQAFLKQDGLHQKIEKLLTTINISDVRALGKASSQIKQWIIKTPFSSDLEDQIINAYSEMHHPSVAVRSSATAEDLEYASFAGQQETYLNVKGINNLLEAVKLVYASLYSSRAISYRVHHGFKHEKVGISVGIQPMIRSDKGTSGVMFTLDTESGFDKVILITSAYGLGEGVVQGKINPDEFIVSKPLLEQNKFSILQRKLGDKAAKMIYANSKNPRGSIKLVSVKESDRLRYSISDDDIQSLAKQALLIEKHYGRPMDIEWAKDGLTGKLYILQARPETVKSREKKSNEIYRYTISERGKVLTHGQSVGQHIGHGIARFVSDPKKIRALEPNEILVADMTDPDWEPIMKRAAAIVTNRGGRTCHAAIVARELGIPAVIGCGDATKKIKEGEHITVSCAEGQTGYVYKGLASYQVKKISVDEMPILPVNISLNIGNPDIAFTNQFIPNHGVGLARLEFIISNMIGIHPNACLHVNKLPASIKQEVIKKTAAYANPIEFYIEKLREGISTIAAAFYPKPVIFRFSDFKSNEYAHLIGGDIYEPHEENPMLGFRGASRYKDEKFQECFKLECIAMKRVRDGMGLTNAEVMIPFVRTVNELKEVIQLLDKNGLKSGQNDLKILMMCEIPSNAILADEFLKYVDGFSIGSNDLTQLTLGLDRDSNLVASSFDERNEAIKVLLHQAITACKKAGKYIGICGQGPSDHPDFAEWLMREGIENISLNPDTVIETWLALAKINTVKQDIKSNVIKINGNSQS